MEQSGRGNEKPERRRGESNKNNSKFNSRRRQFSDLRIINLIESEVGRGRNVCSVSPLCHHAKVS
jgi:hypothetical protein